MHCMGTLRIAEQETIFWQTSRWTPSACGCVPFCSSMHTTDAADSTGRAEISAQFPNCKPKISVHHNDQRGWAGGRAGGHRSPEERVFIAQQARRAFQFDPTGGACAPCFGHPGSASTSSALHSLTHALSWCRVCKVIDRAKRGRQGLESGSSVYAQRRY